MEMRIHHPDEKQEYYFMEGCYILEMWNDPDDADSSIARARVEPGKQTRRHRLLGIAERYLILRGRGEARVGNNPPISVTPGSVVVIPPGVDQSIHNTSSEDLVFLAICTPRFLPSAYLDTEG
jgi:mannose-6-phosphate isomerase-like protein (cupin superfamily)